MKSSIFILGLVLLTTGITFSQQATNKGVLDRLYFKAGAEFYSVNRYDFEFSGDVNYINLVGSIIYDYNDKIQTEFVYKYGFEHEYSLYYSNGYRSEGEYVYLGKYENLTDYNIDLKLNWFLNRDKTINPIYLTGILEFDIQNRYLSNTESHVDTASYTQKYYYSEKSSYNRVLAGPGIGAGIFLAFGRIDFQAEVNSVFRVAPFVDRGYKELLLNVVSGLVYKF
jgi:hypothetical protein